MTDAGRTRALHDISYTEREATFLSLVALHSGYFLRRQYQAFTGQRGGVQDRFLRRSATCGHIRATTYPNRTEVYHVFARSVYRAIGDEDNRNRRSRPAFAIKAKLMALDFVLADPDRQFLATEWEKREYFCRDRGFDDLILPGKTYSGHSASESTRRCFIEKYPIFLDHAGGHPQRIPSFCYVDEGVLSNSGFASFLKRYRRLFVALRRFRLVYVAAEHKPFPRTKHAFERFAKSVTDPKTHAPGGEMGEYFHLRRLLETRQYRQLDKAKLDRLRDLSQRFQHPATESRFQHWAEEVAAHERFGPVDGRFEQYRLHHNYDIFGTQPSPNSTP